MLNLKKLCRMIKPRFILELMLLCYLFIYGPLSPLIPLAVGYRSVSDNYNTVFYTGENQETALKVLTLTERAQQEILHFWGDEGPYPGGVRVFLAPASRYYHSSMYNKNSNAFIQGNSIVINLENGREYLPSILRHELSHHFVSQLSMGLFTRYYLPRWLDEGLAVIVSGEKTSSRQLLQSYLKYNPGSISVTDLNSGIQWYRSFQTNDQEISYLYSREIVSFLLTEYGQEICLEIMQNLNFFHSADKIIEDLLGISTLELEREFLQSLSLK